MESVSGRSNSLSSPESAQCAQWGTASNNSSERSSSRRVLVHIKHGGDVLLTYLADAESLEQQSM
jgi:hypothetical protein